MSFSKEMRSCYFEMVRLLWLELLHAEPYHTFFLQIYFYIYTGYSIKKIINKIGFCLNLELILPFVVP